MSKTNYTDPLVAEIERALMPGHYLRYSETFRFVPGLEKMQAPLEALAPEASRALLFVRDVSFRLL